MIERLMINDNIVIKKSEVENADSFMRLLSIYDLSISSENGEHYILQGETEDLDDFAEYWSDIFKD